MSDVIQTLYSHAGAKLADTDYYIKSVLWRLGNMGTAELSADYTNPNATKRYLRPGNRLLLQFSNGLPDWGGVLGLPRSRNDTGVSITAYEGEKLVSIRATDRNETYSTMAPGSIAESIVEAANLREPTGMLMGDVVASGSQTRSYHYENLLDAIIDLSVGYEYAILPTVVDGEIRFYLQWYETYGSDRRDEVLLFEGQRGNVGSAVVDEQGPIWNRVIVAGKGNWDETHPVAIAEDAASINEFGLRELPKVYAEISDEDTLQEIADGLAVDFAWPRNHVRLTYVINADPARFKEYHVGDIVTVHAHVGRGDWEFNAPVRILSRKWVPAGYCTIEGVEWRN